MRQSVLKTCLLLFLTSIILNFHNRAEASRLFVLIAADTADKEVGVGVQQNVRWIRDLFRAKVPKDQLLLRCLEGDDLTPESLLTSIDQCPTKAEDTLVVWWLGRGLFKERHRVLVMPDESRMAGSALRDQLVGKTARLTVMIVDAFEQTMQSGELPDRTIEPVPAINLDPAFESLFFKPSGLVSIDSAMAGQHSLAVSQIGGLLTCTFALPHGVLGDVNDEAGATRLDSPSGNREFVLERGLLWREFGDFVRWDTVLVQARSTNTANYRRALGGEHVGEGQTLCFSDTRLKYARYFVEWYPEYNEFRSRPRETRVTQGDDGSRTYVGEQEFVSKDMSSNQDTTAQGKTGIDDEITGSLDAPEFDQFTELGNFRIISGDHLVELNGMPIHTSSQFKQAVERVQRQGDTVHFVCVDNHNGERIHYRARVSPDSNGDLGVKTWCWKNSHVIVHDIRPGSPADRARATRIEQPQLPDEIGLGVQGTLIRFKDPFRDGEQLVGLKVRKVTAPERNDLKPGDIVFMIDGCNFGSVEGYRYALINARQLSGLWFLDGHTGEAKHGHVFLPHSVPEEVMEPPEDAMTISISPANIDSCPIW